MVAHWIISFLLHISAITSPANWHLYRWVSWNISEVINKNSLSAFNYLDDFTYIFNNWKMNNKQQSCTNENCMSRTQEQKGFIPHWYQELSRLKSGVSTWIHRKCHSYQILLLRQLNYLVWTQYHTCKQRSTIVHICTLLHQFRITVFISMFVQIRGMFLFKWEWTKLKCYFFTWSCQMQQEVPTRNILEMFSCLCGPTK